MDDTLEPDLNRYRAIADMYDARVQARLAEERDAFRGATAGENYGDLGPDLMSLIGSYHTEGIQFNDGSGASSSEQAAPGMNAAAASSSGAASSSSASSTSLSPAIRAKIEAAIALIEQSDKMKFLVDDSSRGQVLSARAQNRRAITDLITRRELAGVPIAADWSFSTFHALFYARYHRWADKWDWLSLSMTYASSRTVESVCRVWAVITDHQPNGEERERLAYFFEMRKNDLIINSDGSLDQSRGLSSPGYLATQRERFEQLTAQHELRVSLHLTRDARALVQRLTSETTGALQNDPSLRGNLRILASMSQDLETLEQGILNNGQGGQAERNASRGDGSSSSSGR